MSSQVLLTLSAVLVTVLVLAGLGAEAFEYSGYCAKMCQFGRGGNLCKCSAVHFAGKRAGDLVDDYDNLIQQLNSETSDEHVTGENEILDRNWDRLSLAARVDSLLEQRPQLVDTFKRLLKYTRKRRMATLNETPSN